MAGILYFSYGSNMDNQSMKSRCPEAELIGAGFIDNYKLVFTSHISERKRTGADILFEEGKKVWGLIYQITENDLLLLDANKAYPKVYNRKQVTTWLPESANIQQLTNVWTYELNDKSLLSVSAEKEYINLLTQAAKQHHFPEDYIADLQNYALTVE